MYRSSNTKEDYEQQQEHQWTTTQTSMNVAAAMLMVKEL